MILSELAKQYADHPMWPLFEAYLKEAKVDTASSKTVVALGHAFFAGCVAGAKVCSERMTGKSTLEV